MLRNQLVLFILALAAVGLACGSLDSAVDQAEEAAATLEVAASELEESSIDNSSTEAQDNDFCTVLSDDEIMSALGASELSSMAQTVGSDQATCGYTLDSQRGMTIRVDANSTARPARMIYDDVHVASFGSGPGVEAVEGPWTKGFWNPDVVGVFGVKDDEVAFSIRYTGGDASDRDGLLELMALFFERVP